VELNIVAIDLKRKEREDDFEGKASRDGEGGCGGAVAGDELRHGWKRHDARRECVEQFRSEEEGREGEHMIHPRRVSSKEIPQNVNDD